MSQPHILEQSLANFEGVYFGILNGGAGDDLRMPGWSQDNISVTRHIPGSNRNVTFQMGRGPMTIAYRVHLATETDHAALQALVGDEGVLLVPKRICELPQTDPDANGVRAVSEVDYFGRIYKRITEVKLMDAGSPQVGQDGTVETTLSFQRNERPA